MGNAKEYQNLLEPPSKQKKVNDRRKTYVIYGQCNKLGHSKERCHWNLNSSNNKLKDEKEIIMNGVSARPGGIGTKLDNKGAHK
jgi:hypothetical protein